MNEKIKGKRTHHGFGLGIERSNKVGSILLLESNTRPEWMTRIILKNAPGSIIN